MNIASRKIALTFLSVALACPWLAFHMHSLAVKAAVVNIPSSVNLRSYANALTKGHPGKDVRARANAIRLCLGWENALWVFAVMLGGAGVVLLVRSPHIKIFERRQYRVELEGCKGVTLKESSWLSPFALHVNGRRAPAGLGRSAFRIPRDDGTEVQVHLVRTPFDVPRLRVGNATVRVVPPLDALQWGIIVLPLVLVLVGGALGGALGAVGALINARIVRCDVPKILQLLLVTGTTAMSCVCYLVGFLLFMTLFRG
jgi:hypothetical protein